MEGGKRKERRKKKKKTFKTKKKEGERTKWNKQKWIMNNELENWKHATQRRNQHKRKINDSNSFLFKHLGFEKKKQPLENDAPSTSNPKAWFWLIT